MNNEPVAWMYQDDESRSVAFHRDTLPCGAIPLYTHPAKTLTDEEIDLTGKNNDGVLQLFYMIQGDITGLQFKEALNDFARAILKKASEK